MMLFMFKDILIFIIIWIVVITSFTVAGMIILTDVEELKTFENGALFWLQCGLGNWDTGVLDVYDESLPPNEFLKSFGTYMIIIFVFINIIVLLNVVIAMMADTYS